MVTRISEYKVDSELCDFIIASYSYRFYNGLGYPYIQIKNGVTYNNIILIGYKQYYLSLKRRCISCYEEKEQYDYFGYCTKCLQKIKRKQLDCIVKKAGKAFGKECDPKEEAQCQDHQFMENYCRREQVLYIGRIGNNVKIGTTRRERGEDEKGYVYRLMEQGLDEAIVLGHIQKMNLPEAQKYEALLAKYLEIDTYITTQQKIEALMNKKFDKNIEEITEKIMRDFTEFYIVDQLELHELSPFTKRHEEKAMKVLKSRRKEKIANKIIGEIIYFKGGIIILKDREKNHQIVNIKDYIGLPIYCSEG